MQDFNGHEHSRSKKKKDNKKTKKKNKNEETPPRQLCYPKLPTAEPAQRLLAQSSTLAEKRRCRLTALSSQRVIVERKQRHWNQPGSGHIRCCSSFVRG